jgi:outer membrane protein TolC
MTYSFKGSSCLAIGIYLLIATTHLFAQNSPVLSLQDLINASQQNQPAILKKQALISSDAASIKDAKHTALPSLKLSDQASVSSANGSVGTILPLGAFSTSSGNNQENIYKPASGNVATLYSEYELENFGLNKARVGNAASTKALDEADLSKDLYLLQLKTARYYFQLLKAFRQLNIEQDNVLRYDTLFTIISAQAKSGLRAGADSAQTKAELSKARMSFNSRMQEIGEIKQDLSYLTGYDVAKLLIDTGLQQNQNGQLLLSETTTTDTLQNPLIDYFYKQKSVLLAQDKFIKKSFLPKLLLVGGTWARGSSIDYNDAYQSLPTGWGYQKFNYAVGLSLNYNLFDLIHRHDKVAVNKHKIEQSNYALDEQKLQLKTASGKADVALNAIHKNMAEIPIQIASANHLYHQKLAQYQAGVSNLVDLTNAAYLLFEAQTANIQIVTDWYLAKLDKAAADGNLSQFIQSIK